MGVKCLAQEHNTVFPARTRTRTIRSGVEHTNHEDTAPPTLVFKRKTTLISLTKCPFVFSPTLILLAAKKGKIMFCYMCLLLQVERLLFMSRQINQGIGVDKSGNASN